MNTLVMLLRLLHVGAGVFWVGAALVNAFFLGPAVAATADAGQKVMGHLMMKAHLTARVTVASYVTVIAGAALYWIDSQGFASRWTTSGPGIGFGIGALAAVGGFGFGQLIGKYAGEVGRITAQVQGAPTAEQLAAVKQASAKLNSASMTSTLFLIITLICMATARYWRF